MNRLRHSVHRRLPIRLLASGQATANAHFPADSRRGLGRNHAKDAAEGARNCTTHAKATPLRRSLSRLHPIWPTASTREHSSAARPPEFGARPRAARPHPCSSRKRRRPMEAGAKPFATRRRTMLRTQCRDRLPPRLELRRRSDPADGLEGHVNAVSMERDLGRCAVRRCFVCKSSLDGMSHLCDDAQCLIRRQDHDPRAPHKCKKCEQTGCVARPRSRFQ